MYPIYKIQKRHSKPFLQVVKQKIHCTLYDLLKLINKYIKFTLYYSKLVMIQKFWMNTLKNYKKKGCDVLDFLNKPDVKQAI